MPQPTHLEFQSLDVEGRRAVVLLAPLLRIAVALDQSQEQLVEDVLVSTLDKKAVETTTTVEARSGCVEQWHAEQVCPASSVRFTACNSRSA